MRQKHALPTEKTVSEGDSITIDGSSGAVFLGEIPTIEPQVTEEFKTILSWSQKNKKNWC